MTLVVDASVALKWFLHNHPDEADTPAAQDILAGHAQGRIALLQPPHFLAEVCAVLARLAPQAMHDNLQDLLDLSIPTRDDSAVYARALQLSHQLGHHLFDTLYHAVALETDGAVLVTADDAYRRKALEQGVGQIVALSQWQAAA
jgi:predicted nucleic acid-binding protein